LGHQRSPSSIMIANENATPVLIAASLPGWAAPRSNFWRFLRDELTLSPPRTFQMFRMTALVMLVVIVSMALRVPSAAISAYMIFFVSKADVATTARVGIGGVVGVTIALLLSLVFYSLAFSEPALRLPLMGCAMFVGMYFLRASPKGVLGMLIGFVTTYALTLIDQVPSAEALTRLILWTWVFVGYPIALLVLLDIAVGRRPADIFRDGVGERLQAAGEYLSGVDDSVAGLRFERFQRAGVDELEPYAHAGPRSSAPIRAALLRQVELLYLFLRELPAQAKNTSEVKSVVRQAGEVCLRAQRALIGRAEVPLEGLATVETGPTDSPNASGPALTLALPLLGYVKDIAHSVIDLRNPPPLDVASGSAALEQPSSPSEAAAKKTESIQFALKVTLAAMTAYLIYTGLDWSGIHTALITCFFVAQDSVGATIHKLTLRILGAIIGAALGISAIVFVLPHLESAGGLALVTGAVMLPAAWIATGSQSISYMGLQIAFAFCLTVLQGFSRTSHMVVGRDRVIGIILGNVIMSLVFTFLWPVRVRVSVRRALSRSLDALAAMIRGEPKGASASFQTNLGIARKQAPVARLEPGEDDRSSMIPVIESLFVPIHVISQLPAGVLPIGAKDALRAVADAIANWLSELAKCVTEQLPVPAFHEAEAAVQRLKAILKDSSEPADALQHLRRRCFWLGRINARIQQFANKGSEQIAEGAVS